MIDAFIGSLLLVPYNFIPQGWAECNGQSLQIARYQELFSIIGNMYGGDGINVFNLPSMPEVKDANGNTLNWMICYKGIYPQRS